MQIKINTVISEGLAYARTKVINKKYNVNKRKCTNTETEIKLYEEAIEKSISQLVMLENDKTYNVEEFINVHKMILLDPILKEKVSQNIITKKYKAPKAFSDVMDEYICEFDQARSIYLKERKLDMIDIKQRVLSNMATKEDEEIAGDFIAVVEELVPTMLVHYKDNIKGVIAKSGGHTSHSAILCKSLEIPYIILDEGYNFDDNVEIIIDTRKRIVNIYPKEEDINEYYTIRNSKNSNKKIRDMSEYGIGIFANVSTNEGLSKVLEYNINGVGLYRTEMIFMNLDRAMTYEEQYDIYNNAVELLKERSICFRTFDIGDDKQLSYIKTYHKGIDNYINNKELFEVQVKALLNANKYNNMKIMFPMIETYDEYLYLKKWVLDIKSSIGNDNEIKIGMMLETKKAIEKITDFIDVEFISLGTNDLTHELYHVNREEAMNYSTYINDLMVVLKKVAMHCADYSIPLSICGELASVKEVVGMLYETGIRNYSVSVSSAKTLECALVDVITIKKQI